MPYLIDGHNLIPHILGLDLAEMDDEIQLIQHLQKFSRISRKNIDVYFDNAPAGMAQTQKYGRVTAHFIRSGRTADDAIIARLKSLGRSAKNWQVVSSDRQVAASAQSLGARVIPADAFAQTIITEPETRTDPGGKIDPKLDPNEIDAWLDVFGRGGDD